MNARREYVSMEQGPLGETEAGVTALSNFLYASLFF